jgi:hypothetical protein
MMYGAKIWRLDEGWKDIDIIHGRLSKKILGIPRFAANGVAELDLEGQGIMSCCEISARNSTNGQGRTSKDVL